MPKISPSEPFHCPSSHSNPPTISARKDLDLPAPQAAEVVVQLVRVGGEERTADEIRERLKASAEWQAGREVDLKALTTVFQEPRQGSTLGTKARRRHNGSCNVRMDKRVS